MRKILQFFVFLTTVLKTNGADEVIYVQVGDNVELHLPSRCDSYYVRWFFGKEDGLDLADMNYVGRKQVKNDDIWKDKLSLSDKSALIIKNIEETNFGTFVCRVSDNKKVCLIQTFQLFKVSVSMHETSPVIPGDSLTLSCNVESQPKPSVFWINPMSQRQYTGHRVQKTAETRDNGEWTCVVEDNGKESNFKLPVSVVDFSSASEHLFTSTNFPLTVPFLITPNTFVQQIPTKIKRVQWFFIPRTCSEPQSIFSISPKDEQQEENPRGLSYENFTKGGNFSLYRKLSKVDDRGNYTCSITFTNGFTINRTVLVEVLQILPSSGTELISGQPLNLSCSTGGPLDPDVEVIWFPPKTSSLAKDKLLSSHLVIPRVGTEDSGSWRCELRRSAATLTSAVITLKIEPILTVWMLVTICAAALILILLLALAFTLFRRRQRKMRHLRHQLCQCKTPKPKGFYKA